LRSLVDITNSLVAVSPEAKLGREYAEELLAACDATGRLPPARRAEVGRLVEMLETRLA
jgi:hypothetical protein